MLRSGKYIILVVAVLIVLGFTACTPSQTPVQSPPETTANTGNVTDNQTDIQAARPTPEERMPRISLEDLKQKMDSGADIVIVDTRHKEEYDIDHIKGAVSAPMDDIIAGKWQPPAGKELILYCG